MRKLFFIISVILLASCSSDSENPAMLSNSDWSIYGIKQLKSCLLWLLSARILQQQ